jgi:mRNA interferase MazF
VSITKGDIWLANLDPTQGSEQAGVRPALIFQNDVIAKFTTTVLAIPLTTNLRRAALPSCVTLTKGEQNLPNDSVALCHQLRVLDKTRLIRKIGQISKQTLISVEICVKFTMGML